MTLALLLFALYVLLHGTAFRYQRYTLIIARNLANRGFPARSAAEIQVFISPISMTNVATLSYIVGLAAAISGVISFGWWWLIVMFLWLFIGTSLFYTVWPFPTNIHSRKMAEDELEHQMDRANGQDNHVLGYHLFKMSLEVKSLFEEIEAERAP